MLVPRIGGRGCGFWPTPCSTDAERGGRGDLLAWMRGYENLHHPPRGMWPTPQAHDTAPGDASRIGRHGTKHGDRNLNDYVAAAGGPSTRQTYPTPRASDGPPENCHGRTWSTTDKNLHTVVAKPEGGQLNPEWVEWLMGVPMGWTNLRTLATLKWRGWLNAFSTQRTRHETLPAVRWTDDPAEMGEREIGRDVQAEAVLQPELQPRMASLTGAAHGQRGEAPSAEDVQGAEVSEVRSEAEPSEAPQGWESEEQSANERERPLLEMPYGFTRTMRVATGVERRVDRLRALGNAQVPAVAAAAWTALKVRTR